MNNYPRLILWDHLLPLQNLKSETVARRCSVKKILKISQYSQENTFVGVTLIMFQVCNFPTKRLHHKCFSVKISNNFKNTFSEKCPWTAASVEFSKEKCLFNNLLKWQFINPLKNTHNYAIFIRAFRKQNRLQDFINIL